MKFIHAIGHLHKKIVFLIFLPPHELTQIHILHSVIYSTMAFILYVMLRPHPHTHSSSSRTFSSWPAGDQLVVRGGVTHISLPLQEYDRGRQEKIKQTNKHKQSLGLTESRRRYCNTTCMCGLSLAWVTSENSTSNSNADILSRSSSLWLDPLFSATFSGVRC